MFNPEARSKNTAYTNVKWFLPYFYLPAPPTHTAFCISRSVPEWQTRRRFILVKTGKEIDSSMLSWLQIQRLHQDAVSHCNFRFSYFIVHVPCARYRSSFTEPHEGKRDILSTPLIISNWSTCRRRASVETALREHMLACFGPETILQQSTVFSVVTQCNSERTRHFRGTYHLQSRNQQKEAVLVS